MKRLIFPVLVSALFVLVSSVVIHAQEVPSQPALVQQSAPSTSQPQPMGIMEVILKDGKLSIKSENADLIALLKKISEISGVAIDVGEGVSGNITIFFTDLPFEEGINKILNIADSKNYAAIFEKAVQPNEYRITKIAVVRNATLDAYASASYLKEIPRTEKGIRDYLRNKYGTVWMVDMNAVRNIPEWIGGEISVVNPISDGDKSRAFADSILKELANILSINSISYVFKNYEIDNILKSQHVDYIQHINGVPVENALLAVNINTRLFDNKLGISITNHIFPDISISTIPKIDSEEAIRIAEIKHKAEFIKWGLYPKDTKYDDLPQEARSLTEPPSLLIMPLGVPEGQPEKYEYHLCWKIRISRVRTYFVDAHTSKIVETYHSIKNLFGTMEGQVYLDNNSGMVDKPLSHLKLSVGGINTFTMDGGSFEYSSSGDNISSTIEYSKDQSNFRIWKFISPYRESEIVWPPPGTVKQPGPGSNPTVCFLDVESVGHEQSVYYYIDAGYRKFSSMGTVINGNSMVTSKIMVNSVNPDDPNVLGWTTDNTHIYISNDGSCSPDVILHELTHAAVYGHRNGFIYFTDNAQYEALDEGVADYYACQINSDPDFYSKSSKIYNIDKDASGNERKPIDIDGDEYSEPNEWMNYDNGNVVASILWDLTTNPDPYFTGGVPNPDPLKGLSDMVIWGALNTRYLTAGMHSTMELYSSLAKLLNDPSSSLKANNKFSLLWNAFGEHGANLGVELKDGDLHLSWLRYYGDSAQTLPTHYKIYSYENPDPNFDPVLSADKLIDEIEATNTTWIDPTPFVGDAYYRVVPVYNGVFFYDNKGIIIQSNQVRGYIPEVAAPKNLQIGDVVMSPNSDTIDITVRWDPVNFNGKSVKGYRVTLVEGNYDGYSYYDTGTTTTSYTIFGLEKNKSWTICIRAFYYEGGKYFYGPISNEVQYPSRLDLPIVLQTYFPYDNYTAGYLRRYRWAAIDLLRALRVSLLGYGRIDAGTITLISSGRIEGSTSFPQTAKADYQDAIDLLGRGWPDPTGTYKWSANRIDEGIDRARQTLNQTSGKSHIRKALIFTNWFHYDKDDADHQPPIGSTSNRWVAPYEKAIEDFQNEKQENMIELNPIDFYPGGYDAYKRIIANANKTDYRFPYELDKYFYTNPVNNPTNPPPLADKVGYLVIQDPYPNGVTVDWNRKLPRQVDSWKVEFPAPLAMNSAGVRSPRESWGRASL